MVRSAPGSVESRTAVLQYARDGHTFITPVFCIGEFWRVVTEPRGYGADAGEALAFLNEWLARAPIAHPDRRFERRFLREVELQRPVGAAIFDLAIGTVALHRGATEIWTADARFPPIHGLTVYDPLSGRSLSS